MDSSEYTQNSKSCEKHRSNSTYIVFSWIKDGLSPSRLWKEKRLKIHKVKYALQVLRHADFVEKIGKGVWITKVEKYNESLLDRSRNTHRVALSHTPLTGRKKPDSVRAHGMVLTLSIPKIPNWERRKEIMDKIDRKTGQPFMKYKPIPQGQRIMFEGCKIWLCDRSIVVYFPKRTSWYIETAPKAAEEVLDDSISTIKKLEKVLHVGWGGFKTGNGYKLRFSRNHYSLIRNAMAKQYDDEKRKLFVYDDTGLWLTIDNSFNLHELETVHSKTAKDDNVKIQDFFNGVKHTGITPEFILEGMNRLTNEQLSYRRDLVEYGEKIAAHSQSVEKLGIGVDKFTDTVNGAITKFSNVIEEQDKNVKMLTESIRCFIGSVSKFKSEK